MLTTVSLIKVKSCSALLHMLLIFVRSYLKSVPRYKVLGLDTCHPDTIAVSKYVSICDYF